MALTGSRLVNEVSARLMSILGIRAMPPESDVFAALNLVFLCFRPMRDTEAYQVQQQGYYEQDAR